MPLKIIRDDISRVKAHAIVNTANHMPVVGSGVDSRIHQQAGSRLLEARKETGVIEYGKAAITPGFNLNARYVIHAVSPIYDSTEKSVGLLKNCYKNSLDLALKYKCKSIAFPVLSSGNNGFPADLALQTAVTEISKFLMDHDMIVYLVVFNNEVFTLSEKLFNSVKSYIDENYVEEAYTLENDYQSSIYNGREICSSAAYREQMPAEPKGARSLEDLIHQLDETFSQSLIRLIHQKNLEYPDVYKAANVDRKLFSKIKNNPEYQPKKTTAVAFAIALKLNLDETKDLLAKAGYALSHSSKFDIIIEYFITEGNYDIFEINEVLFAFDQNLLM